MTALSSAGRTTLYRFKCTNWKCDNWTRVPRCPICGRVCEDKGAREPESLWEAVQVAGSRFFKVTFEIRKSETKYKEVVRSRLRSTFDAWTWREATFIEVENIRKILQGEDKENVRIYADVLTVIARPIMPHLTIATPRASFAAVQEAEAMPTLPLPNETVRMKTWAVSSEDFYLPKMWREVEKEVVKSGLRMPDAPREVLRSFPWDTL